MARYSDRSDPGETALTSWIMAALSAAAAAAVGWMLGWPWVFDMNDPEFNPMLILEGILIGLTVFHLGKGAVWRARARRFGAVEMELDGPVPVRLGRTLAGRLRLGRPVRTTGDWVLELVCEDIHESRDTRDTASGPYRQDAFPVWRGRVAVPAGEAQVVPFRFELPASVGPKPVPALSRQRNPYFRFSASIRLPGFRRIVSSGPPVGRRWVLTATAPTEGPGFRASFPVPVEEG